MRIFKKIGSKNVKKEYEPDKITTLSQIGSRKSIAQLHVKKLLEAFKDDEKSNHIFYIVDPQNKKLLDFIRKYETNSKVEIYTKYDNKVTNFKELGKGVPGGGDANYDFLLRLPEVGSYFLTLHDDSIITSGQSGNIIRKHMKNFDFCAYLDTRGVTKKYNKLLIDNVPLGKIRLGTWFLFGKSQMYINSNYQMGLYKTVNLRALNKMFHKSKRLTLLSKNIWLNGGMPFNIQARLDNRAIMILNDSKHNLADHLTKVTGFFAARGMLEYANKAEEVEAWKKRFNELYKLPKEKFGTMYHDPDHDKMIMMKLAEHLEMEGIYDELLNRETIKEISRH